MKRLLLSAVAGLLTLSALAQGPTAQQSVRVVPVPDRPTNDLSVRIWTDKQEYRVGERMRISYRASRDAYVLIFTTDPNGETRQLLPNSYDNDNFVEGGETYTIPNRGYSLEVTPPSGRETISIVAFKERNRSLDAYRSKKAEAFPKSDGPRAAVSRVVVRPDDQGNRGSRYAEDSTTIRVTGRDSGGSHRTGRLSISSDPSGAYVYINNEYRGITPLDMRNVRTGSYDVVLNRPGYYPARRRVRVSDDERTRVDVDLSQIRYR